MSRKTFFIKPDLNPYIKELPAPYNHTIKQQYDRANTRQSLTDLCHYWLNSREKAENPRACYIYTILSHTLFSILTNRSYESKLQI